MRNNIFLANRKTNNNSNDEKYNPDVVNKYKNITNSLNKKAPIEFVNDYYKGVTNQPIKNIKSAKELKLEKDTPDKYKSSYDYDNSLQQRLKEKEIVEKSILNYKKANNIKEKSVEELNREYLEEQKKIQRNNQLFNEQNKSQIKPKEQIINIESNVDDNLHIKLKSEFSSYTISKNDKLLEQKKRFNQLLEDIDNIF
jgi:hypothetical protein